MRPGVSVLLGLFFRQDPSGALLALDDVTICRRILMAEGAFR